MSHSFLTLAMACTVLLLTGCANYTTIRGSDAASATPFLRLSTPLDEHDSNAMRLQLRLARQEGRFKDHVASGERAAVDDTIFPGPTTLTNKAGFTTADVRVSVPHPLKGETLKVETDAGIGLVASRIEVSDPTRAATLANTRAGPVAGAALVMNNAQGDLGLRLGLDMLWAGDVVTTQAELLGTWAPNRSVELMAGYRYFTYRYRTDNRSDMDVSLSGPAAGLHFRF